MHSQLAFTWLMWNTQPMQGDNCDNCDNWLHTDRRAIRCYNRTLLLSAHAATQPTSCRNSSIYSGMRPIRLHALRVFSSLSPQRLITEKGKVEGLFLNCFLLHFHSVCTSYWGRATLNAIPQHLDYECKWLIKPSHGEAAAASITWSGTYRSTTSVLTSVTDRIWAVVPSQFVISSGCRLFSFFLALVRKTSMKCVTSSGSCVLQVSIWQTSIRRCHHSGLFQTNQLPFFSCDQSGRRLHAICNLHPPQTFHTYNPREGNKTLGMNLRIKQSHIFSRVWHVYFAIWPLLFFLFPTKRECLDSLIPRAVTKDLTLKICPCGSRKC